MAKLVSKVYGDALFSLAVEENRVDELWDETRAMKQVLSENPDFMAILEHPECAMAYKKIGKVQIQTPMPLSEKQKKKIEQKLLEVSEYETLSVDYEIDKSLLGGIVIRIGNQVLDNSIRAKLDAMTRDLSKVRLSN